MRITNIELVAVNQTLDDSEVIARLDFEDPEGWTGFKIKSITGLGAEEVKKRFSGFSESGKRVFTHALGKRVLSCKLELFPSSLFETRSNGDVRDDFYKAISAARVSHVQVKITPSDMPDLATGEDWVITNGYITKVDTDYFSENPLLNVDIDCSDPLLYAGGPTQILGASFTDETLIEVTDTKSTAPHGFVFKVNFDGPSYSFVIKEDAPAGWEFEVIPGILDGEVEGFIVGDKLEIVSEFGRRGVTIERDDVVYNVMERVSPNSVWPMLYPGTTTFAIEAYHYTIDRLIHTKTYWGV